MSIIIVCTLPEADRCWMPDPFPGGDAARGIGCTCPKNQPWPGQLAFDSDCPIHELEKQ